MNIGIYARKSVYSDKSDSVDNQIKICMEYAQNNYENVSFIKYSEDEGFTGANTNRPGFTRLMEDVTNKRIDVLICYKIDRISRNVLDFSRTFNTLQENSIQFVSVKEQIDTSTPLGRAMMYICSVFAQMERETTAERVKDNMIELAKSGKWAGGKAPVGFKRDRITLNGKHHTILVENKEEAPFVNMIFNTFLEGYSLGGLETYFRKKGIKTLDGYYLSASQLYIILKNPHYVAATKEIYDYFNSLGCIMAVDREKFNGENGLVVYGRTEGGRKKTHKSNNPDKWIVSIGLHKPLIEPERWLSVQKRFGKNKIDKTRKHEIGILKGIVKCKCGYTMRVKHKVDKIYNKVYDSYFCQNRSRRGMDFCDMKMISVNELDSKLINTLKQLTADKRLLENYIKQPEISSPKRDISTVKREINNAKKKIDNLTIALQDNTESTAVKYIIAEIENLDKQITGLQYEILESEYNEQQNQKRNNDVDIIYNKICNYVNIFDSLDYTDKVKYLQEIVKDCIWDGRVLTLAI